MLEEQGIASDDFYIDNYCLHDLLNIICQLNHVNIITDTEGRKILKRFNLKFDYISCPEPNLRAKPWPDQIFKCIKKFKIKKKNCTYIGDSYYDYLSAKKAGISFIFAKYGYSKDRNVYKEKINSINFLTRLSIFE